MSENDQWTVHISVNFDCFLPSRYSCAVRKAIRRTRICTQISKASTPLVQTLVEIMFSAEIFLQSPV